VSDISHKPVWWTISEERLLELLHRVANGEDPDMLYMSEYASADKEDVPGGDDDDYSPEGG